MYNVFCSNQTGWSKANQDSTIANLLLLTMLADPFFFQAMKEAGVKPGVLTYNTLISCCQQAKRLEDAFRIKVKDLFFVYLVRSISL